MGEAFFFPFFYYLCTYYDTDITHTGAAKAKDAVADRILFRERSLSQTNRSYWSATKGETW
jgi:hypothetical protein